MISSDSNRVVVTGMGIVSPCGIGVDSYWDALINCKSGIGPITRFDASDFPVKIAGEVKNFDMRDYFGPKCRPHRYSLQTQFGLVACQQALNQAGLTPEMLKKEEVVPVVMGVASSANHLIEHNATLLAKKGAHKMPLNIRAYPPAATAGAISQEFGFQISPTTISSCCPSGLDAVGEAAKIIKSGQSDMVIAGAVDSCLTPVTVASFSAIRMTSPGKDYSPEESCRPFDKNRGGVVLGEGAGILVLERFDSALSRGAIPIVEIVGSAKCTDCTELLDGMEQSMNMALRNSGIHPDLVDYICADASGQPLMDLEEVKKIKRVFGKHAYEIPVSSIRGVMGHGLASAALMQIIASALAIKNELIPPTANLTNPDPECDLDHVPLIPRKARINISIVNSHGLASENGTLVLRRML